MAKRPPSNPSEEADLVKPADDLAPADSTGEAVPEAVTVEPVALDEPPRTEAAAHDEIPLATDTEDSVVPEADRPAPQTTAPPPEKSGGGGFLGTALGGVVAAAAGYALAIFVPLPGMGISDAPPVATQADLQALAGRIEALESAPAPDSRLEDRLAALEARSEPEAAPQPDLSPLTDSLTGLESRIAAIESRPAALSGEGVPADLVALVEQLRAEIAEIQSSGASSSADIEALAAQTEERLAQAEAQAASLRAEAEATAQRAVTAAALSRLQAALESGAPFSGALADLSGTEVPPSLSALAETGVPSRKLLEDGFPAAARAALDASRRADMGDGWTERLGSLFQATTGVRSLTPREGTDPDAVLSRAEAAVATGDLAQALAELQGLPPEGLAEMAEWSALAQQRLTALEAVASLSAAVKE
ncbi:hypothetical protein EEB11_10740 [Pseudotabrizicola sediminis]|uniref:Inner membrane protein n=1 Tax=Pseudotabrizicola sediminis TaxID=2486418 RepID=A0ABY2KLA9_9RHOB|nr:hypothetical protein [Pseudotabrizicola sediminis]TGD43282.1 hypothetical protein EEB11_10740 [Pseudotabrizicola sediminis]